MTVEPTVLYRKEREVGVITLNRPHRLNAYSVRMRDELAEALSAVRDDDEVRVMVLRGAGRAFCVGGDLTEFGSAPSPTAARRIRFARDVWGMLYELKLPTVARLHGYVVGSGVEMAALCDIRVAAASTRFAMPETKLGMIPAAGGTKTIPQLCGMAHASWLLLTSRELDATQAAAVGLVSKVVADDGLDEAVAAVVDQLLAIEPRAAKAVLEAVHRGSHLPLDAGVRVEARLANSLRALEPLRR